MQFGGLEGGIDDESAEDYQDRITERWRNPQTPFNPARIGEEVKLITGNTRVWVRRVWDATLGATSPGCVSVWFVRDGDTSIIPTGSAITTAKAAVDAIMPANTYTGDVHVNAPTAVPIDITVTNVIPGTASMVAAIEAQITAYYRGPLNEGETHSWEALRSEIQQTYDVEGGEKLRTFDLDTPTTDTAVPVGSLATEGTVSVGA